jgi:hypothetical protein
MAAKHKISSCCDTQRMQRGCWMRRPASVISVVMSMVALLVLQQCPRTYSSSAAAATTAVDGTARNSRVTVTAPPADYLSSSAAITLRSLSQPFSVMETHRRQRRMLHQQPATSAVSRGSMINTAVALDTQQDAMSCVENDESRRHAYCKRSDGCEKFCARPLAKTGDRSKLCVCCKPGHYERKHKVYMWKSAWSEGSVRCMLGIADCVSCQPVP